MADRLATAADLLLLLGLDPATDPAKANLIIELATAGVQAATGRLPQRIVEVVGDQVALTGTTDSWLSLPQRPVNAVTSVVLDGVTLSLNDDEYRVRGSRLWRASGWQTDWGWPIDWPFDVPSWSGGWFDWSSVNAGQPSVAIVSYSHGYADGDQRKQLARGAVLSIGVAAYRNPGGYKSESIDDYSYVAGDGMSGEMLMPSARMCARLAAQYGPGVGLVRVG